jgi:hypothetical protein
MSRPVLWAALGLFLLGAAIFSYKTLVLEMPIRPDRSARVWRVELSASFRGDGGPARLGLLAPRSESNQILLDEQTDDDGLAFEMRREVGATRATWFGRMGEVHHVAYSFRVHLPDSSSSANPYQLPERGQPAHRLGGQIIPATIRDTLQRLGIDEMEEPEAIIASVFGFVANEIEGASGGSEDELLTLSSREGSQIGRSRLMVALLRAAGIEAHLVTGLHLGASPDSRWIYLAEARTTQGWLPLVPTEEVPGKRPRNLVILARGDRPLVAAYGIAAYDLDVQVLRESLQPAELAAFMTPPSAFWQAVSLYRLPLETQSALNVLLVIPPAALLVSIFRNLVGLHTFGTFMPMLIALSLRRTDLFAGAVLVTSVLAAGVVGRLLLDRLRLLFVPRLCLLLSLVVICVTALAQLGHTLGGREMMRGLLFPMVILAMLIERISVTTLEEGYASAARLMGGSILLSFIAYPVFRSDWIAHLYFGFPELVLCTMAPMVLIGGYTGYRLSELWRFRSLAQGAPGAGP